MASAMVTLLVRSAASASDGGGAAVFAGVSGAFAQPGRSRNAATNSTAAAHESNVAIIRPRAIDLELSTVPPDSCRRDRKPVRGLDRYLFNATDASMCFLTIQVVEVRLKLSELFCNALFALAPDAFLTIKSVETDR
jgi:hypothetical protein